MKAKSLVGASDRSKDSASSSDQAEAAAKSAEESKNREMDELIHSQSEAYQAQFLQGSIPKVIYKHAMKGFHSGPH